MADSKETPKTDLTKGVPLKDIPDGGMITGLVGDDEVMVARRRDVFFAVGAHCTHYHGPLADGLLVGDTVRCPWHHACFDLRTGEPLRAPALDPLACWRAERVGDTVFVRERMEPKHAPRRPAVSPESVLIIGGGAAGLAAADMLRREGYDGAITMISADDAPPVDRPNLSKDFLAGTAKEDWIPLRESAYYKERRIDLRLGTRVSSIDVKKKTVQLDGGKSQSFGALLIATGAEPVKLDVPVSGGAAIRYLRTFADSRARRNRRSSLARASSAWKSRRHCERVGSACMLSRRSVSRSSASWDLKWGSSSGSSTKNTAWSSTLAPPSSRLTVAKRR